MRDPGKRTCIRRVAFGEAIWIPIPWVMQAEKFDGDYFAKAERYHDDLPQLLQDIDYCILEGEDPA